MSNISNLFENLMTFNEINNQEKKPIVENDSTLLNLTVELPNEIEDIKPDDVKVDVGIMNVDTDGVEDEDTENDEINVDEDTPEDVTPDSEDESDNEEDKETKDDEKSDKEEALMLRKEAIRKRRLEAKQLRKANKTKECTGKEDCECESCKVKKESIDGPDVAEVLFNMIDAYFDGDDEYVTESEMNTLDDIVNMMSDEELEPMDEDDCKTFLKNHPKYVKFIKSSDVYKNWFIDESCKVKKESSNVETAKTNIRKRVTNVEECDKPKIKKEALMHLDTKSLNKLMTEFVKENYKNIDKVTITKAILENRMLKLEGTITNTSGESKTISITNRGFDASKLEGKRFVMDFRDTLNTFGIIKESIKNPFVFTCTLVEGILKFESLKYDFKTKITEGKIANVCGTCNILKESKSYNYNKSKSLKENADQVKKFNEIVDKIKAAKSANDLTACKDEMDEANLGDTLLSAAQMVWDDVNSRMAGAVKNK